MLRDDPTVYLAGGPSNRVCLLQVNLEATALQDARVRRLISRAIDRERLVQVATAGQATPTGLLFPADSWAGGEVEDVDALSGESIREELRLLGIPTDLRLRLLTNNADATLANTAVVLQEQLASCGIALSVDLLEDADLEEAIRLRDYDIVAAYTEPWRDPHELVRPLLGTDGLRNFSGYADERVEVLIRGGILREDRAFRRERYTLIERAVQEDVPVIVLFHPYSFDAVSAQVTGYSTLPPVTARGLLTVQPPDPDA
jgi:peptide/nickel transport system substrate-binding protein